MHRLPMALLLLVGCAPDLREDFPFDGQLPEGSYVSFQEEADGSLSTKVNATHKESWVYVDLDERRELGASEAISSGEWDLAFQRFKIISNGGVSGSGPVEVCILEQQDFAELTQAPTSGYLKDAPDSQTDSDQDVDSAFLVQGGWYYYDLVKHRLTTRDVVYVVRTTQGNYAKLQMLDYYDQHGTAAQLSLRWQRISPP